MIAQWYRQKAELGRIIQIMMRMFALLDLSLPELVISFMIIVVVLAFFVFEVAMFVHAIQNRAISSTAKLLWIMGMLLIHPFVAIVYYFTDYKAAIAPSDK